MNARRTLLLLFLLLTFVHPAWAVDIRGGGGSGGGSSGVSSITGTANQVTASGATGDVTLSLPATINVNTSGSAATLTTARTINGTSFNGSANITVTAAAGTLTGTTLNSTIVISSLTSVGTLTGLSIGAASFTPLAELEVSSALTTTPRGIISSQHSDTTDSARFGSYKSRGTQAGPTLVTTGDILGRYSSFGYDGTNYIETASVVATSEGTIAATRVPSRLDFFTGTDAAPTVMTQRLRIDSAGLATFAGPVTVGGTLAMGANAISFTDATLLNAGTNILAQRNGANAQAFQVNKNTTNPEWVEIGWQAVTDTAVIRTNTSGGTVRSLNLNYGGTTSRAIGIPTTTGGTITMAGIATGTASSTTVDIGGSAAFTATSGTNSALTITRGAAPVATSTMVFRPISITPTVNYSAGTPGAGNYDIIFINVTETALGTGTNTLMKLQTGGTDRFSVSNAGAVAIASTFTSSATGALGWSVVTGANTACNTTCTSACVFGEDTSVVGTIVACTDATADVCVCAGAS